MKAPSFSIIMPTYNRAHCICNAIDSVLKQTYSKFELVIIDDGSTDGTYVLIQQKYKNQLNSGKIIYKRIDKAGMCRARNEGLKIAKNEWIAYIDSDNTIMPYFLGVFAKEIMKNPDVKNFYAQYQPINKNKISWRNHTFSLQKLKDEKFINLGAYVHNKSLIKEFNENSEYNDDEFILNQCIKYNPIYIPIFILNYNINKAIQLHNNSTSNIKISEKNNIQNISLKNDIVDNSTTQKIVCYTCITGEYDQILDPLVAPSNIDFICFSDQKINSRIWKWRPIPEDLKNLDLIRQQRSIKICPHKYLKDYKISIWVDGNIQIKDDLNKFINQYNLNFCSFWVRKHPNRDCIYDEARECIAQKKAPKEIIEKQISKYKSINYPCHNGLIESGIILRNHTNYNCQKLCNVWLSEVLIESYRDQLSFNYACWATKIRYGVLIHESVIIDNKNKYFNWNRFHSKKQKYTTFQFNTSYVTIAVCNFNTTQLTNNCIKSIYENSNLKNMKFIILDNSNNSKFKIHDDLKFLDYQIIDNTNGHVIDFDLALKKFSKIKIKANNNGSLKHCLSIQYLINLCNTRDMILFDSDTILIKSIDFINQKYITIADLEKKDSICPRSPTGKYLSETRFLPFIQYFNCEMIKNSNIKYFDANRIHGGLTISGNYYDTGASFYEDILNKNIPFKQLCYTNYVNHLNHGSWKTENNE